MQGLAYQRLEQWDQAIERLEAAVAEMPTSSTLWTKLGEVYYQSGNLDEAEQRFQHALKLFPSHADAHLGLAKVLTDQNRHDEARSHLEKALAAWADADADFEPAQEARQLLDAVP